MGSSFLQMFSIPVYIVNIPLFKQLCIISFQLYLKFKLFQWRNCDKNLKWMWCFGAESRDMKWEQVYVHTPYRNKNHHLIYLKPASLSVILYNIIMNILNSHRLALCQPVLITSVGSYSPSRWWLLEVKQFFYFWIDHPTQFLRQNK